MKHGKITVYNNVATNSPRHDINDVLKINKIKKANSIEDATHKLKKAVKKNGKQALLDIGDIHPDRDLIIASLKREQDYNSANGGQCPMYSNMCPCSADGEDESPKQKPKQISENIQKYFKQYGGTLLVVAIGFGLMALAMKGKP